VDTGRVIHRRYLLQRLVKRGPTCAVYQGFDQVLQRTVAVKVAPAEHIPTYRAAIRATSQFNHPNIVGIYDLIIEPETLYIVQEYVDGDEFAALVQTGLPPHQVADFGIQLSQALLYAGTPSRKICHGDLTPAAVIRDRRGLVRINNFALPSDMYYFTSWSTVGGNNIVVSDRELPYGQLSEGRRADDTRAVGLLLYQLLAGRSSDSTAIEPPADGRLRFLRNIPPELCEVVARAIIRQHPQHIRTPDVLQAELKTLAETLEPATPIAVASNTNYQAEDPLKVRPPLAMQSGKLVNALPLREGTTAAEALANSDTGARLAATGNTSSSQTLADVSLKLAAARQAAYGAVPEVQETPRRINIPVLLAVGLVLFALFFAIGYVLAHVFIP